MTEAEVMEIIRSSVNELLRWVGFGTLTGLAAKAIMPGRDPGGAVSTMLIGIGGSVIGCGTALFFCATPPSTRSAPKASLRLYSALSLCCSFTACWPGPFSAKRRRTMTAGCLAFAAGCVVVR